MVIRSYRSVFDLERRIYRIDRLRLNPGGVPVRGVVYWLALLAVTLLATRAPLVATVVGVLPWYVAELALPLAGATLLSVVRIEGRPFHLAAQALLRHQLEPRRPAGELPAGIRAGRSSARVRARARARDCWWPGEIVLLPDGSDARMRKLRYSGRGAVLVTVAHERTECRWERLRGLVGLAQLTLRQAPGVASPAAGQVVALAPKARLRVR